MLNYQIVLLYSTVHSDKHQQCSYQHFTINILLSSSYYQHFTIGTVYTQILQLKHLVTYEMFDDYKNLITLFFNSIYTVPFPFITVVQLCLYIQCYV